MRVKYLGEAVRQRRKLLGVPQERVCEGLCTAMTLSRFESGQQTPSWDCVVAILQRLGLPDDRYYAQLTRAETQLILLRKEALACYSRFEQTLGDEQQQARVKALEKLKDLESRIKKDDHINQQFILGMRATLETHPPQKRLEMLMEAIRLTSPQIDLEELNRCLYCANEVAIIIKIANVYSHCGQRRKSIDICRQMLKLILKQTPKHNYLPLIAYNCARHLALEDRFDEALEISRFGRKTCIKQGYYHALPRFLHIEAECHYLMGELSKSMELYQSAYHIYGATMDMRNQSVLKTDALERFNLVF